LYNNVIWQNRTFNITVGGLGTGPFEPAERGSAPSDAQPAGDRWHHRHGGGTIISGGTGACVSGANYWDIGVRGDTGPQNHASGVTPGPGHTRC